MRSIRVKILVIFMAFVFFIAAALTLTSVISVNYLNAKDSDLILEHLGKENAGNIDRMLTNVEHSVDNMYYYAFEQLESLFGKLFGTEFRKDYLEKVASLAISEAKADEQTYCVYYHLTDSIKDEPVGFVYRKNESGELLKVRSTDLSLYDENDLENVGWYYIPKNNKAPTWIAPYNDDSSGTRVVSYIVPVYVYGRFAGVIGMDIDINVLFEELQQITVYNSGSAIVFDTKENIFYQKGSEREISRDNFGKEETVLLSAMHNSVESGHPVEYNFNGKSMKLYAYKLVNGMTLCIMAPVDEINASSRTVLAWSVLFAVLIDLAAITIIYFVIRSFLNPLKELADAAAQLANGSFDVHISYNKDDEIGQLSRTFSLMSASLKKYYEHFHNLAYTDALTGLNNKNAFTTTKDVIESEIKMKRAAFVVIVMDINNLKIINDTIGHEHGDILLRHVTECMRSAFVGFPLYRIGGDEFCAIVNNCNPQDIIDRLQAITAKKSAEDYEIFQCSYQIAAGAAVYNRNIDYTFDDVFHRADKAMYENKKMLKNKGNDNKTI